MLCAVGGAQCKTREDMDMNIPVHSMGAFHLVKFSGISGSAVHGTRFVGSFHWKIPWKNGKSKKAGPYFQKEFRVPFTRPRSLYQSQVHGKKICHGQLTNQNGFPRALSCINARFVFLLAYNGGTWYHEYPGLGLTGKYLVTSNSNIYSEVHIHWIESSGTATYRGLRPNETTFYQSEIPLLLPPKFPGLFPKWKAPSAFRAQNQIHYVSFIPSRQACLVVKF